MKKYTKEQMLNARIRSGRLTEMMMIAHNEKIDRLRKLKKTEKDKK